jgi:hypothetical protein
MPGERKSYIFRHRAGFSIGCAVNLFAIWSAMAKASSGLCALETRLQMTVNIHSMSAPSHSSTSFSLKTDKTLAAAGLNLHLSHMCLTSTVRIFSQVVGVFMQPKGRTDSPFSDALASTRSADVSKRLARSE